jgi:hypothetical protein
LPLAGDVEVAIAFGPWGADRAHLPWYLTIRAIEEGIPVQLMRSRITGPEANKETVMASLHALAPAVP